MEVDFDGRNDVAIEWLDVLPLPSSGVAVVSSGQVADETAPR